MYDFLSNFISIFEKLSNFSHQNLFLYFVGREIPTKVCNFVNVKEEILQGITSIYNLQRKTNFFIPLKSILTIIRKN